MLFFLLLLPLFAHADSDDSVFRSPLEFFSQHLIDARGGAGYLGEENIRVHNANPSDNKSSKYGPEPLYDLRIGPVNITNIYSQAGFTQGKSFRMGTLFSYAGDSYAPVNLDKRSKSFFGGGFLGYKIVTAYVLTDLLGRKAGTEYTLHIAPHLFTMGGTELFLILELEHMNRQYVDYYFGIRRFEASAIFPYYEGVRTTNFSANLLYDVMLSKRFEFLIWGGQKRYGSGVRHSPTIGIDNAYSAGVGFLFRLL
ncbi:MAG: MipA/OmpV family protein [Bdellovibrionota bacterium]